MGLRFPFGELKCSRPRQRPWLHNAVNIPKATELFTLR